MSNEDSSVSLETAFLFSHEYRASLINKTKYHKRKQVETEGSASLLKVCIHILYLFLMLFPINYKLGEREEDNLSVKFKLLTNKREMFETELPLSGKKKSSYPAHLRIINQSTRKCPCHQLELCPSCRHSPTCPVWAQSLSGTSSSAAPDLALLVGWLRLSLPCAPVPLTPVVTRWDSPSIGALAYSLGKWGQFSNLFTDSQSIHRIHSAWSVEP